MAQSPTLLVFPHQLFANHPGLATHPDRVILVEDDLFFGDAQYPARFHKQKLWLHRASMQRFRRRLEEQGLEVDYFEHRAGKSDGLDSVFAKLAKRKQHEVVVSDPHDFMLRKRLLRHGGLHNVSITFLETPMFLNTPAQNKEYRDGKKRWFMADYYKHQRRRLDVLMEEDGPVGGQWSYDKDNRKKEAAKQLGVTQKAMCEQMMYGNQGKFTLMAGGTHGLAAAAESTDTLDESLCWNKMKEELIKGLTKSLMDNSLGK